MRKQYIFLIVGCALVAVIAWCIAGFLSSYPHRGWEQRASALTALTTALYWEAGLSESDEGLHAIFWTIQNRVRSEDFPNSIRAVVTEGVMPGKINGCQFSFACDRQIELPHRLCELHPIDTAALGPYYCERRWLSYFFKALWWLYINPGTDPTCGGAFYFTGKAPYWIDDLEKGSIKRIGSHTFGRSQYVATDLAPCTDMPRGS